ncbi:MAG: PAS domain S-box protein, partial [Acidobacteria bacterium]|nr:PAS domain S-box protein [Acidobacteriota bacterium]
ITSWNKAAEQLYGYLAADVVGKPLTMLALPADIAEVVRNAERIKDSQQVEIYDTVRVNKDGREMNLEVVLSPVRDSSEAVIGVSTIARDVTERRQAVEALRQSEEKYRTLFNSIDEGFLLMELLTDDAGKAVDIRYLEANPAIERQTGLSNLAGNLATEVVPGTELPWLENMSEVARTGESMRFENYSGDIERWYSVYASRVGGDGSRQVVCVFGDITERKRRERNLAFLADIEKRFASLTSSEEISKIAGALIGEHFDISHCLLVDINEQMSVASVFHDHRATAELPSLIGDYALENFHTAAEIQQLAAGQPVVVNDVLSERYPPESGAKFDALGTRALVTAPYVRDGRWKFAIGAHVNQPRQWREDETEFLTELATRVALRLERARAEEALRQSEETFSALVGNSPFGVYLIDAGFRLRLTNEGSRKVFGGIEPLIGRDFAEILHILWQEPFATKVIERFRHTLRTGESFVSPQIVEKRANIEEIESYDWQIHRVLLPDGSYGVVCYFYDLSEQKRLEETVRRAADAVRGSEERLRLTTESVTDYAIFTTDTEGRITSWNVGAENIFGFTEEEAVGQLAAIIFTPEDRAKGVPEMEMKTAREKGRASDERWHIGKDGTRFYVSGVLAPLRDGDRVTGYAKIARDLTEQRRAEETLRRAHDELEARVRERTFELAKANETLRGEISERIQTERERARLLRQIVRAQEDERRRIARDIHDQLGQQMTALRLNLDALEEGCGENVELHRKLEQAKTIAERLDADVDFLAWELRPIALDDIGLAEALSKFVREWSKHSGVEAQFHTTGMDKERLPPETETNLYRITQEALNNTMKYARARRVDVLLERRDHQVVLIVEDDGVGFDPAKEAVADGDKGMGLIGMRERAVLAGGSLEIESMPKKGTTIFARVPVRFDEEQAGEAK